MQTEFIITRVDKVAHSRVVSREKVIELLRLYLGDPERNEEGVPIKQLDEHTNDELCEMLIAYGDEIDIDGALSDLVTREGISLGDIEAWAWEAEEFK